MHSTGVFLLLWEWRVRFWPPVGVQIGFPRSVALGLSPEEWTGDYWAKWATVGVPCQGKDRWGMVKGRNLEARDSWNQSGDVWLRRRLKTKAGPEPRSCTEDLGLCPKSRGAILRDFMLWNDMIRIAHCKEGPGCSSRGRVGVNGQWCTTEWLREAWKWRRGCWKSWKGACWR